jgi:TP901 family phage tail tape measure protein
MATVASQLIAKVSAEGVEKTKADLTSVGKTSDDLGGKISGALKFAAIGGGLALLGVGAASLKMAGDFQAGITSLATGAGESQKNLQLVSDGILKMAVNTGTSTQQLISGMYMIESAGFHGKAGLDVLQAAAEGAKVGNADLGVVANGVTTIMVDYAKQHVTAAQATNMLVATVAAGKTHMQDLANALSTIAPTAAAVGLHVTDMNAALATMTGEGTDAASAATYLRQLLIALEAPGGKAASTLKEIGLSSKQVSDEMKLSLPATLQLITDHLKKKFPEGSAAYVSAIKDIAGGSKQMQGILELTGTHLQTFKDNVTSITDAVKAGGDSITGWNLVQEDFNQKLEKVKASVEVLAIKFGRELMPIVTQFLGYVEVHVLPRLSDFSDWFSRYGVPVVEQFTQILETTITRLIDFVSWMGKGSAPAQLLTGAAIALGIAIAGVKIGSMVSDMTHFVGAVPEMVGKMFLVQQAADGIAGAKGLGEITTEAGTAEKAMATAADGMKLSLAGILGAVGGVAGLEILLAKWIRDNNIVPTVKDAAGGKDNNPDWVTHVNRQAIIDAENKKAAQDAAARHLQEQIAWRDMADLTDEYQKNGRILGTLGGVTNDFSTHLSDAQHNAVYLKAHLDDLSTKPWEPQIITTQIEKAMSDARVTKLALEDLSSPVTIQVGTRSVTDAIAKVMYLKSHADDLGGGTIPGHASGILNSPTSHWSMVGESGPEMMYVPQGSSILPNGVSPSGGVGGSQPVVMQIDGRTMARLLMPYIADQWRYGVGVTGR